MLLLYLSFFPSKGNIERNILMFLSNWKVLAACKPETLHDLYYDHLWISIVSFALFYMILLVTLKFLLFSSVHMHHLHMFISFDKCNLSSSTSVVRSHLILFSLYPRGLECSHYMSSSPDCIVSFTTCPPPTPASSLHISLYSFFVM